MGAYPADCPAGTHTTKSSIISSIFTTYPNKCHNSTLTTAHLPLLRLLLRSSIALCSAESLVRSTVHGGRSIAGVLAVSGNGRRPVASVTSAEPGVHSAVGTFATAIGTTLAPAVATLGSAPETTFNSTPEGVSGVKGLASAAGHVHGRHLLLDVIEVLVKLHGVTLLEGLALDLRSMDEEVLTALLRVQDETKALSLVEEFNGTREGHFCCIGNLISKM